MGKFINPFTDFGFKHIFGREMDKDILIEFLNDLLEGEHTIKDLRIMNNERLPETEQGRKVIFDIHCETDKGERIIIEMKNREQPHFKDRALYYLSHSVVEQGIKGTWDYELAAVYGAVSYTHLDVYKRQIYIFSPIQKGRACQKLKSERKHQLAPWSSDTKILPIPNRLVLSVYSCEEA